MKLDKNSKYFHMGLHCFGDCRSLLFTCFKKFRYFLNAFTFFKILARDLRLYFSLLLNPIMDFIEAKNRSQAGKKPRLRVRRILSLFLTYLIVFVFLAVLPTSCCRSWKPLYGIVKNVPATSPRAHGLDDFSSAG
jgi:predicted PurR-regulated permease PerM